MSKKSIAKLKKEADKWFSKYIRHRDSLNGITECITCGVQKPISQMQNGHFVTRSASAIRYDEFNCNSQCPGCNLFKQGEQYKYGKALDLKYGKGTADKLMARRHELKKWKAEELEKIIQDSKEYLDSYPQI